MLENRNEIAENLRHISADKHELAKQLQRETPDTAYIMNLVRGIIASAVAIGNLATQYQTDTDNSTN
jgi:hypothetical protein